MKVYIQAFLILISALTFAIPVTAVINGTTHNVPVYDGPSGTGMVTAPVAPSWGSPTCSDGTQSSPFTCDISGTVSGTYTPTCSLATGTLPTGVTVNSNCSLSGTPTNSGVFAITVTATNGAGSATSGSIGFTIAAAGASIGTGCDCDLGIYDYCQGTTLTSARDWDDSLGTNTSTITLTFSATVNCGSFITGSRWVAPTSAGGTVTINSATPTVTGSGSTLRNGLTVNPTDQTNSDIDGRLGSGSATTALPLAINTTTQSISSVMKGDSWNDAGACNNTINSVTRMCLEQLFVLTVLDDVPAGYGQSHIRPAFFGTSKSLRALSSFDLTKLPSIPQQSRPSGAIAQDVVIADSLAYLAEWKIDWLRDYPGTEQLKAYSNFPGITNGYNPNNMGTFWAHLTWLTVDVSDFTITAAQKNQVAYHALEHGMDVLEIVLTGAYTWAPNGGHATGRYGLGLIAAVLSTDANDLTDWNTVMASTTGPHFFAETGQISQPATYPVYGAETITGGKTFADCSTNLNTINAEAVGKVDIGDFDNYPAAGTDCVYTDTYNEYQDISYSIMFTEFSVLALIPDVYAALDSQYSTYVNRMYSTGSKLYTGNDPANAVIDNTVLASCSGGTNDGYLALDAGTTDCPGGTAVNRDGNFVNLAYNSKFGQFTFDILARDGCVYTSTCTGQP